MATFNAVALMATNPMVQSRPEVRLFFA